MMHLSARSALLVLALASLPWAQQRVPEPLFPFVEVSADGGLLVPYGPEVQARLLARAGDGLALASVPLPGRGPVSLTLRPVSALAPGASARLVRSGGTVERYRPRVRCFFGSVAGGGAAFLGLTETRLEGFVEQDGETFFLSTGPTPGGAASITAASSLGAAAAAWCGFVAPDHDQAQGPHRPESARLVGSGPVHRTADVFLECDPRLRNAFGTAAETADYAALLVTLVSEIYRRDLGVSLRIPDGYLRVWDQAAPWGPTQDFGSLDPFMNWWRSTANPERNLPRAAVHALTRPSFGGVAAAASGLCNNQLAYEVSGLNGSFPNPWQHTDSGNWDPVVVAHEFGHTFGSGHTWEAYVPRIACDDDSGPDRGTIMSYCHLSSAQHPGGFASGGVRNIGLRFHRRVQERIRGQLGIGGCLAAVAQRLGDYDLDGDVDATDLAVADGLLAQGFVSLAAQETFDIDRDGDFDRTDRGLLASIVAGAPAATAVPRNGGGTNTLCYFNTTAPRLGSTWESAVVAFGAGTPTFLIAASQPDEGRLLAIGELLVKLPGVGGDLLFVHAVASGGFTGDHHLVLPADPALAGARAFIQGMVGGASVQLCNRLDVTLGPFE